MTQGSLKDPVQKGTLGTLELNKTGATQYEKVLSRLEKALPASCLKPPVHIEIGATRYPFHHLVLGQGNPRRALLSAGIHGDEPAGVETLLTFLEEKLYETHLDEWELTLIPCVNPSGFDLGTRETSEGIDLNRKFHTTSPPEEVKFVQSFFDTSFDLDIELHEDIDSPGYYLFQKENEPVSSLGREILNHVSKIMPINMEKEIEELPADKGLLARLSNPDEMEWWPMAIYAYSKGCRKAFTLESATRLPMETRVRAHLKAIEIALSNF